MRIRPNRLVSPWREREIVIRLLFGQGLLDRRFIASVHFSHFYPAHRVRKFQVTNNKIACLYLFDILILLLFDRSLNLEQEAQGKQLEKDKERASLTGITTPSVPAEPSKMRIPNLLFE